MFSALFATKVANLADYERCKLIFLARVGFFRTRSIVNAEGEIQLSRNQIVVESDDNLCLLDGGKYYKW